MKTRIQKLLSWASNVVAHPFGQPRKYGEGELHYVSGIRRCLGALADLVIVGVVLQVLHGCFLYAFPKNEATFKAVEKYRMGGKLRQEEAILKNKYLFKAVSLQAIQFLIIYTYYVYMWVKFSTTIGTFLMGLRVIDENSLDSVNFKQATKRFFCVILSGIPLGIGIIWSNFDAKKRAWHDMLAKTIVVTNKSLQKHKGSSHTL
ncbi:MAG: RDD family protein [Aaplasma endosymbiont of Hyalomma asiaticum]